MQISFDLFTFISMQKKNSNWKRTAKALIISDKISIPCLSKTRKQICQEELTANPAGIYLLKANNRNTRARCEICSNLTISFWCLLVLLLLTLNIFLTLFQCFYYFEHVIAVWEGYL